MVLIKRRKKLRLAWTCLFNSGPKKDIGSSPVPWWPYSRNIARYLKSWVYFKHLISFTYVVTFSPPPQPPYLTSMSDFISLRNIEKIKIPSWYGSVGWVLSIPWTKGLLVHFSVRKHAWVVGLISTKEEQSWKDNNYGCQL